MITREPTKRGHQTRITFVVPDDHGGVSVVGDFNSWRAGVTVLRPRDGVRSASLTLATGRRYRFRYLRDDGMWFNDGDADAYVANEYGEEDGVLDLTGTSGDDGESQSDPP